MVVKYEASKRQDRDDDAKPVYAVETVVWSTAIVAAEGGGFKSIKVNQPHFPTLRECQQYVDDVTRHPYWKATMPDMAYVQVRTGRGRSASSLDNYAALLLPVWARTPGTILHELAHQIANVRYGVEGISGHGPEFRWELVQLVRRIESATTADRLKYHFTKRGLTWVEEPPTKDHNHKPVVFDRPKLYRGEISRTTNKYTKGTVVLINQQQGYQVIPFPYVVGCLDHKKRVQVSERSKAERHYTRPWEFCPECRRYMDISGRIDQVDWADERRAARKQGMRIGQ